MRNDNFIDFIKKNKEFYLSWEFVYCKALNSLVYFNMKGFNHLRFKIDNTPRSKKESLYKISLLPLVRPVIYKAINIKKYQKRYSPIGGSNKKIYKNIEYWSLVERVGKKKVLIKVILRRIGNGKIHFWSVMKIG